MVAITIASALLIVYASGVMKLDETLDLEISRLAIFAGTGAGLCLLQTIILWGTQHKFWSLSFIAEISTIVGLILGGVDFQENEVDKGHIIGALAVASFWLVLDLMYTASIVGSSRGRSAANEGSDAEEGS